MTTLELLALTLKGRAPGPVDLGGTLLWWEGERVVPTPPRSKDTDR
jgi:hypothetical protein